MTSYVFNQESYSDLSSLAKAYIDKNKLIYVEPVVEPPKLVSS